MHGCHLILCVEFWEAVLSRGIITNIISQGSGLVYSACWTLVICNYFSSLIDAFKAQKKKKRWIKMDEGEDLRFF